jgi:ubiquinone/menaquinone biosynthesis C-methylase UbiE
MSTSTPLTQELRRFYNAVVGESASGTRKNMHGNAMNVFIDAAGLKEGDGVLDLGTGTGRAALLAAEKFGLAGKIFGLDISDNFLELACERAVEQDVGEFVEFNHKDVAEIGSFADEEIPAGTMDT